MRLYAYGGNGHVERARVGKWPGLIPSVFGDKADVLQADSFGVGLVDRKDLHLIYRTYVKDTRDGYAFTLLLGPSEAAWQKCDWNAARLLEALLAEGGNTLMNPDDLLEADLKQIEDQACRRPLPPAPAVAGLAQQSAWHAACIGASFENVPLVATPKDVGLTAMPNLAAMGRIVAQQPACFRIGDGWMVGGTPAVAETLRAKFLLSPSAKKISAFEPDIERGRQFLISWSNLRSPLRDAEERRPMHLWQDAAGLEAAFISAANVAIGNDSLHAETRGSPLKKELATDKEANLRAQLRKGNKLPPGNTTWLLTRLAANPQPEILASNEVAGLDSVALKAFLSSQGVPPTAAPRLLQLSSRHASDLAVDYLSNLNPFKIPSFTACCDFLKPSGVDEVATLQPALEKAIDQKRASISDLAKQAATSTHPAAQRISKILAQMLARQMQNPSNPPGWLRDVILMGLWDEKSSEALVLRSSWHEEVLRLKANTDGNPEILRWLQALVSDPILRPALSLSAKRSLAQGNDGWKPFRTVDRLLQGGDTDIKNPAPINERAWLIEECEQIAQDQNWRAARKLPQLKALHSYLTLPPETVAFLDERIRAKVGFFKRFFWSRTVAQFPFSKPRKKLDEAAMAVANAKENLQALVKKTLADSDSMASLGLWLAGEEPRLLLAFLREAKGNGKLPQLLQAMEASGTWSHRLQQLAANAKDDPAAATLFQYAESSEAAPTKQVTTLPTKKHGGPKQ